MYVGGGISYFSNGSGKRPSGGSVCPEAAGTATSERRQKKRLVFETLARLKLDKDILALLSSGSEALLLTDVRKGVNTILFLEAQIAQTGICSACVSALETESWDTRNVDPALRVVAAGTRENSRVPANRLSEPTPRVEAAAWREASR
jgi:hypothetical protein